MDTVILSENQIIATGALTQQERGGNAGGVFASDQSFFHQSSSNNNNNIQNNIDNNTSNNKQVHQYKEQHSAANIPSMSNSKTKASSTNGGNNATRNNNNSTVRESPVDQELNKQLNGFDQYFCNSVLQVTILLSLLVTFALYWGVFFYDLKCTKLLGITDGIDRINFIMNSATDINYQDFFVHYKLLFDITLFFSQLVCSYFPPQKRHFYYVRHVLFYADFILSLFTFVKLDPLMYYDDISQFRSQFKRYSETTTTLTSFQSTFENYYVMLRVYVFAVLVSAILQLISFGFSTVVPIKERQQSKRKYIVKEDEDTPFNFGNFQPEWKSSLPVPKDIMIE